MNLTNLKRNISMVSTVLIINLFFDRITKVLAVQFLKDGPSHHYLYNTFVLKYAENSGAFLSMGADW
ncbi:MAG TPA: signal peptidase II, partial [Spirochaetota bacterium]|nr:signal peptidase II [Spirochaetota bacterium]